MTAAAECTDHAYLRCRAMDGGHARSNHISRSSRGRGGPKFGGSRRWSPSRSAPDATLRGRAKPASMDVLTEREDEFCPAMCGDCVAAAVSSYPAIMRVIRVKWIMDGSGIGVLRQPGRG